MRLNRRLQKAFALAAVAATAVSVVPATTYAKDYEAHWAKDAIDKWSSNGVLEGYEDGTFRPSEQVKRGELAAIIVRVFGLEQTKGADVYTDVDANKWYADEVAKVSAAGIMNDYEDGTFRPEAPATREEAAYAIAKAYSITKADRSIHFADQAEISDWAQQEVLALATAEYLHGNPDGTFKPQSTLTRAEVVTMIDKITAELFSKPGTYKMDIEGNVVINSPDVVLEDMVITGNVYIAEGVGEGDVILKNVTLNGDLIVEGGGKNSVKLEGRSKVNNIIVNKAGEEPVRILVTLVSEVLGSVVMNSNAILEGQSTKFGSIIIDGATDPQIEGDVTIQDITVQKPATVALVNGPIVEKLVVEEAAVGTKVRGRGTKGEIKSAVINANGVVFDKSVEVDKNKVVVADTVTDKPEYSKPSGGGGGGGGTKPKDKYATIEKVTVTGRDSMGNAFSREIDLSNTKTIKVDVSEYAITINNVTFRTGDTITGVSIDADNATELSVSYNGTDLKETDIQVNHVYSPTEVASWIGDSEKDIIIKLLEKYAPAAGLQQVQIDLAKEKINHYYNSFQLNVDNGNVGRVDYFLDKAQNMEILLEDPRYVDNHADIYALLAQVDDVMDISLSGLESDIKKLTASVGGLIVDNNDSNDDIFSSSYTVTVTYNGK